MIAYADRLTAIGVQHGTLAGYDAGCRAELSCPARRDGGLSCLAVRIRYAGDWQYRGLLDAGVDPQAAAEQLAIADARARADARANARRVRRRRSRSSLAEGNHPNPGVQAVSGAYTASDAIGLGIVA